MNKVLLLLAASIVILVIILNQWVGITSVWEVMLGINPLYVPVILALPFLTLYIYSYRWAMLLESVGAKAKPNILFKYALIGMVFNNLTPMVRFGGEPVKGYLLAGRLKITKKKVFASLAMDSIITLVSLIGLMYFAAIGLMTYNVLDWTGSMLLFVMAIMPVILGMYIIYNKRLLKGMAGWISGFIGRFRPGYASNLHKDVLKFRENIKTAVKRRDILAKSMGIAIIERLLEILGFYIIFISLGVDISIFSCALVMGVGILAGNVPLLPGGLVAYESSTIFVLGLLGVPVVTATSAILLWRFASFWLMTLTGLLVSWGYGMNFTFKKENTFKLPFRE